MKKKLMIFWGVLFSGLLLTVVFQNCSQGIGLNGSLSSGSDSSKLAVPPESLDPNAKASVSINCSVGPFYVGQKIPCTANVTGQGLDLKWRVNSTIQKRSANLKDSNPPNVFFLDQVPAGSYRIEAILYDKNNQEIQSNTVTLLVQQAMLVISCPDRVGPDVLISCIGTVSGSIQSSQWTLDGQSISSDSRLQSVDLGKLSIGSHIVSATFIDLLGNKQASNSVTINVDEAATKNSSMSISCARTAVYVGQSDTCVASVAAEISSFEWIVNGKKVSGSSNLKSYTWTEIPAGVYQVQGSFIDKTGKSVASNVVTVVAKEPTVAISCPSQAAEGASITCSATVDGPIQSGYWTVGGEEVSDSLNMSNYTWQNVPSGIYLVQGVFKDLLGKQLASNTATVAVSNSSAGAPTVAINCSSDQIFVGQSVTCSANITGSIVSGYWSVDGKQISGSSSTAYTWKNIPVGTYVVQATIVDNVGKEITSNAVSVTVGSPRVTISCPSTVLIGSEVSCHANVEGQIESGYWVVNNMRVQNSDGMAIYTWKNVPAGVYEVHGMYKDSFGKEYSTNSVKVTVSNVAQSASVIISCPSSAYAGDSVQCRATVLGSFVSGGWKVNGAIVGKCDNLLVCDWGSTPAGSYTVQGYIVDGSGNHFVSNSVSVTVKEPSVSIVCPTNLQSGDHATCSASVMGPIKSGHWTVDGKVVLDSANMASYTWSNVPAGSYKVQGVIVNKLGQTITSNSVSVVVSNPSVTINCPSIISAGSSGTCSAAVTGNISSGYWTLLGKDGVPVRQPHCDGKVSCTWDNVSAGSYQIQGVIVDKFGKEFLSAVNTVLAK